MPVSPSYPRHLREELRFCISMGSSEGGSSDGRGRAVSGGGGGSGSGGAGS